MSQPDRRIDDLREELSALSEWIRLHQSQLKRAYDEQASRSRDVLRLSGAGRELQEEQKKAEALKQELNSLNEQRQVYLLKEALLHKLERERNGVEQGVTG